jgi:hypothetical protein
MHATIVVSQGISASELSSLLIRHLWRHLLLDIHCHYTQQAWSLQDHIHGSQQRSS